jgi:hypothetical protein
MSVNGVEEAGAFVSAARGSAQERQAAHLLAAGALGAARRAAGAPGPVANRERQRDPTLFKAAARGYRWLKELASGAATDTLEIAILFD